MKTHGNYNRLMKNVWRVTNRNKAEEPVWFQGVTFEGGPILISDLETRKTFLVIPHTYQFADTAEKAVLATQAFAFWRNAGAIWDYHGQTFQYDLTDKKNLKKWLERAIERFNKQWQKNT